MEKNRGFVDVVEVASHLQDLHGRKIDTASGEISDEDREWMSEALAQDTLAGYREENSGEGWYQDDIEKSWETLRSMDPDLEDKRHQFVLRASMAILSNGQDVDTNMRDAMGLYQYWKDSGGVDGGTILTDHQFGNQTAGFRQSAELFMKVVDRLGYEGADEFFSKSISVADLERIGTELLPEDTVRRFNKAGKELKPISPLTVTGEKMDSKVPVFAIFGPKVGSFYNNLNGKYDSLTMDRWFMRSFGRVSGEVAGAPPGIIKKQSKEIGKLIASASDDELEGFSRKEVVAAFAEAAESGQISKDSVAFQWAKARATTYTNSSNETRPSYADKSPVNLAANRYKKNVTQMAMDSPANGGHRQLIRSVMGDVLEKVRNSGRPNANMAELQAVLWYHEKRLYRHLGAKVRGGPADSFSGAADRLRDGGIKQLRIKWDPTKIKKSLRVAVRSRRTTTSGSPRWTRTSSSTDSSKSSTQKKATATKEKPTAIGGSDCGANAPGGGGFQPGNDCASGDGSGAAVSGGGAAPKEEDAKPETEAETEEAKPGIGGRALPRSPEAYQENTNYSSRGTDLSQYTNEEIAFMYEQAKADDAANREADPDDDSMDHALQILRHQASTRRISSQTEELARNFDLTGGEGPSPITHTQFMDEVETSGYAEATKKLQDLHDQKEKLLMMPNGDMTEEEERAHGEEFSRIRNEYLQAASDIQETRRVLAETMVDRFDNESITDHEGMEGMERAEAIKRNIAEYQKAFFQLHEGGFDPLKDEFQKQLRQRMMGEQAVLDFHLLSEGVETEQQFFGFDSGERGEAEGEKGHQEWMREQLPTLEAEEARLNEAYSDVVHKRDQMFRELQADPDSVPEDYESHSELVAKADEKLTAWSEANTKVEVMRERIATYGDTMTRELSDDEKTTVAGLIDKSPFTSPDVYASGGSDLEMEYLDSYTQGQVRESYAQHLTNDEHMVQSEIDSHLGYLQDDEDRVREVIRGHIDSEGLGEDEEGNDVSSDVEDSIYSDFISNNGSNYDTIYEKLEEVARSEVDDSIGERMQEYVNDGGVDDETLIAHGLENGLIEDSVGILESLGMDEYKAALACGAPDDSSVNISTQGDSVEVNIEGPHIDSMKRTIRTDEDGATYVYNNEFFLSESAPDGLGRDMFQTAVANAKSAGIAYFKTHAAKSTNMVGYWVWPRFGYSYPVSSMSSRTQEAIRSEFGDDVEDVLDIMQTKKGRAWWKENGEGMGGAIFDMSEGSRSLEVWGRYLLEKSKEEK